MLPSVLVYAIVDLRSSLDHPLGERCRDLEHGTRPEPF
jgi:hypothetical protein